MYRRRAVAEPPPGFFVLLDEEFGFAVWFWVPRMSGGALEAWWRSVDAAAPGAAPLFFSRRNLPGRCILADREVWNRLFTEGNHWRAHAHWEDDSHLCRPDGTVTVHRGYPDVRSAAEGVPSEAAVRWAKLPALTVGPHSDADDATLTPEISELGARIRIAGVREEEAACGQGRAEIVCSLDELAAIAETLTTGRDTTRTVTAWGRAYRSTWSLSGPSDLFEDGRQIWFYPMDQERYTLRILAAPLRAALEGLVTWLEVAAPGLPAADQEAVRRARGWLGGEPTRSPG